MTAHRGGQLTADGGAGFSFKNGNYPAFELAMEEAFGVTLERMANGKIALLAAA